MAERNFAVGCASHGLPYRPLGADSRQRFIEAFSYCSVRGLGEGKAEMRLSQGTECFSFVPVDFGSLFSLRATVSGRVLEAGAVRVIKNGGNLLNHPASPFPFIQ